MKPTIIVELIKKTGVRRFPGRKPEQPWRWIVTDAGNHEAFERPTERYSEERGALDAIEQVHGPDATVVLRRPGHPDRILRRPASRRVELTAEENDLIVDRILGDWAQFAEGRSSVRVTVGVVVDAINWAVAP
ncbi:hypothetical protein BCA37_10600 [Mycobacterium sp. djl-10]|nr:hypothetical protein BCA37_10600 [Mycobacterium sp. djl-10]